MAADGRRGGEMSFGGPLRAARTNRWGFRRPTFAVEVMGIGTLTWVDGPLEFVHSLDLSYSRTSTLVTCIK